MKKISPNLVTELDKLRIKRNVLDIGFGYPYVLYELDAKFDFSNYYGIELIDINESKLEFQFLAVNQNEFPYEFRDNLKTVFDIKLNENDAKVLQYLQYRFYNVFHLKERVCFHDFDSYCYRFKLSYEKSIEKEIFEVPISNNKFDLIIASKVLSHLNEHSYLIVLIQIINLLSEDGIIYLRLNSEDFPIEGTIKHVFNEEKLEFIRKKLNILSDVTLLNQNNKKEYELIGRKKKQ